MNCLRRWRPLLLTLATACLAPNVAAETVGDLLLEPEDLADRLARESFLLVDLRPVAEYTSGHLPGALNLPPETCADASITDHRRCLGQRGISGSGEIVLYEASGAPVADLGYRFWMLEWAGARRVRVLRGGFSNWAEQGRSIERGTVEPEPVPFEVPVAESRMADPHWLVPRLGQLGIEILDLRDGEGWATFSPSPTYREGHLPFSLQFDVDDLAPEGRWLELDETRTLLGGLGPRFGDPVSLEATFVLYGESTRDRRPARAYVLLRAAGLDARVLAGGWNGWTDGDNPVVRIVSSAEVQDLIQGEGASATSSHPLIDLRERRDYDLGHLPGSRSLPLNELATGLDALVTEAWPAVQRADTPLIFYCYGPDCVRSRKACAWAAALGYRRLWWFRGGTEAWREAGLPLTSTAAP